MEQETANLIIGASISLLTSLLTIIVTNTFQLIRDKRIREWGLKDKEADQRRTTLNYRLKEAEKCVNIEQEINMKLFNYEMSILIFGDVDRAKQISIELTPLLENKSKYLLSLKVLNDLVLDSTSNELNNLILAEHKHAMELFNDFVNKKSIDTEAEINNLNQFCQSTDTLREKMMKRLDDLSVDFPLK